MMKKLSVVIAVILVLGVFTGCKNNKGAEDTTKQPPKVEQPTTKEPKETEPQVNKGTNIGGFYLDQPVDDIKKKLGEADSVQSVEEGYYGEPYDIWEYKGESGGYMNFIIGKNTNKVLDIIIAVSGYKTDLGIEVGDSYDDIKKQYGSYKNVISNQDQKEIIGWYDLNNGQIIIFDFDSEDQSPINQQVKPESKAEAIRISRIDYFD